MHTARLLADHGPTLSAMLATQFSLRGQLRALAGECDANLQLTTADGDRYLVKIASPRTTSEEATQQIVVLTHLATKAPALLVPRVVPTAAGATHCQTELDGQTRIVWISTWLDGQLLADTPVVTAELAENLGAQLAAVDLALADLERPPTRPDFKWDLRQADWIGKHVASIRDPRVRAMVADVHARYPAVQAAMATVRHGAIHNDANDYNVMVSPSEPGRIAGLFDFGDLCHTAIVGEIAIAATYLAMHMDDPLLAIDAITRGYHRVSPLTDQELALVVPLVETRLAVSLTNAAVQQQQRPDDAYVTISQRGAERVLRNLHGRDHVTAAERLRIACDMPRQAATRAVIESVRDSSVRVAPILADVDVHAAEAIDLSFDSTLAGDDPTEFDPVQANLRLDAELRRRGVTAALGRYAEPRPIYTSDAFGDASPNARRRTVHLGIDVFAAAGTSVQAPLPAVVHHIATCEDDGNYGGLVVLRHETRDGNPFGTLYGHLTPSSVRALAVGQELQAGEPFATLGERSVNGGWPPHLHLQWLAADPRHLPAVPNGVCDPDDFVAQAAVHPDPSPLLGLRDARAVYADDSDLANDRQRHFASNLATSYSRPLALVRGWRHQLFDRQGRRYLDAYNNVPHVGHCHPHVVDAVARQTALLATNTRYLHDGMHRYAERLRAMLPKELSVCFFTPSGSEANELALRLVRQHTGAIDLCVMDHGYHGHTTGTMAISPYKLCQPGAPPKPDHVHITVQPDTYRGAHTGDDAGTRFAADVAADIEELCASGRSLAGYLCECLPSVGGQLELPDGFLPAVYQAVRDAGGLCIADDVQTGLWRTGSHAFGFQKHGVTPDVLVLGKPLGNGFPLGAVITTRAIADSFSQGPEFFSTFGGSTVAMAAGNAVLDVLEDEGLARNAQAIGDHLLGGLRELQHRHQAIGDVRGRGFFLGVELVEDREHKAPATRLASAIKNTLRERRVLIGTDGPCDNVLKIRPPMTFDRTAADLLLAELDCAIRYHNRS